MTTIINWISTHPLYLFLGLSYFVMSYWMCKFKVKLKLSWWEIYLAPLIHIILGLITVRLMALAEVGFVKEKAASMRLYGAVFTLPFVYYLWARLAKHDVKVVMDLSTINVIIALIGGRINCLRSGCCSGVLMTDDLRWPLVELEMVFYILFAIIAAWRILKGKGYGQMYPVYLICYGVFRFAAEFVREEYTTRVGVLHLAHIWSLLSIVAGTVIYIWVRKQRNSPAGSRKKTDRSV